MTQNSPISWHDAVQWLREQPDSAALVRACFFDDPLLEAAERFHQSAEYTACRAYLPPTPGHALDIGAGRGILSYALAKDGWQVSALEPDPSPLVGQAAIRQLAAEAGLEIEILDRKGECIPCADDSFDLVFCRQVLHHAADLPALCREATRILKPGGVFIATREHVISSPEDLQAFLAGHPLHRLYGGEHAFRLDEYVDAITGAGLKLNHVLNPFESEINLFPTTMTELRRAIARSMRLPAAFGALIPQAFIRRAGARAQAPGRLYSFVAEKADA